MIKMSAHYISSDMSEEEILDVIQKSHREAEREYQMRIDKFSSAIRDELDSPEVEEHIDAILMHIGKLRDLGIKISCFRFVGD